MEELVEKLSTLLLEKKAMLAVAESCTGGMIAAAITERAGSSKIFDRGFVTYSNAAKQDMLDVSSEIIEKNGAVSAECSAAMAFGALQKSLADITISVTGIAGPSGGSAEKPVGLIYFAVASNHSKTEVFECNFEGNRDEIRNHSVVFALEKLIETLERFFP